jgi:hypothetical protein
MNAIHNAHVISWNSINDAHQHRAHLGAWVGHHARQLARRPLDDGFVPTALHEYADADGFPLFWRIRLKRQSDGEKWIRPLRRIVGGRFDLKQPEFTEGSPLYLLPQLAACHDANVWVVEGESCADALMGMGLVATTSGGADSAGRADWKPLVGRAVTIWPDNDDAGQRYAEAVKTALGAIGCDVNVVDVAALNLPAKGDVVDWLAMNPTATAADIDLLPKIGPAELTKGAANGMGEVLPYPDEPDARHVNQPRAVDAMLYGLAGDVGRTAAATTEANPYAVCMGFMSFLSAMAGRDIYLPVGNTRHHPRLFTLHVGRSSRGRKGDALSLAHRIRHAIDKREFERGTVGGSLLGQVHTGGLSTREGLVMFIRDGYMQGKEEVPAVADKRLWVVESEFSNVLHQARRDGNTLSASLRDAWDGVSIKPATKSSPTWASDPHIAIAAAITPTELVELMKARELSNGFANRFIIFWAERERLIPFPSAVSEAVLLDLAERTEVVLRFMRGDYPASADNRGMILDHDARAAYGRLYASLNATTGSTRLDGILERRAPMLLRMAMLFALTDQTLTIEVRHIEAAHAWVTYWINSVRYVFGEAADEASAVERQESADKLLTYLNQKGEADRKSITNECFNKRSPAGGLDAVIAELLNATPPKIEVVSLQRRDKLPGKSRTIYRPLSANASADIADMVDIGVNTGDSYVRNHRGLNGLRSTTGQFEHPMSAKSVLSPQPWGDSPSRTDSLSPLCPLSPHVATANIVEVEI